MRTAQYRILTTILERVEVPSYVYAFERGRSIPAMAAHHVGRGTVISLDLKDFFTSIKQTTLQTIFGHLGVGEAPARTLSELCTYDSFVPQGALTSPKISNIVTSLTFGPIINQYCEERGLTLTIYADDITISCSDDIMKTSGFAAVKEIIDFVSQSVQRFGFRINRRKTKVMRPFQRQYVCGVVVNDKVNLQAKDRKRLRAIVHNCVTNGIEAEAAKNNVSAEMFVSQIGGKINWFNQLNQDAGGRMVDTFKVAKDAYAVQRAVAATGTDTAVLPEDTTSPDLSSSGPQALPWALEPIEAA